MKKELRVNEIMRNLNTTYKAAEKIFYEEVTEKYGTKDVVLAEAMYKTAHLIWRCI